MLSYDIQSTDLKRKKGVKVTKIVIRNDDEFQKKIFSRIINIFNQLLHEEINTK